MAAGLALGGAGCSALPAIRESAPILSMDAPGSPEKTSACIVTEVTQAGPDVSILRPPERPTPQNSTPVTDPALEARIKLAMKLLGKDVVTDGDLLRLEWEGRLGGRQLEAPTDR